MGPSSSASGRGLFLAATLLLAVPGRGDTVSSDTVFDEVAADVGLDFVHFNGMTGKLHFSEMTGAGGALLDFDDDGDLDVFLVQGDMLESGASPTSALFPPRHEPPLSDRLYRNSLIPEGVLRFTDVTTGSGIDRGGGYGMGVATGDYDNDGDVDLYVTNLGSNRLWRNRGTSVDGMVSFEDATAPAGADDPRWSVSASFLDYDRDGWLDLYVVNYVDYRFTNHKPCFSRSSARDYCGPDSYEAVNDRLLRNRGKDMNGRVTFEDVTAAAGIAAARGPGLGVVAADFDRDGWVDLFIANDGSENFLWHNRGGEGGRMTFEEQALLTGCAVNLRGAFEAGMGVDAADFDDDGDLDLFLVHLDQETNTLYVNDGLGNFQDRTLASGLGPPSLPFTSFGTGWLDFDNDGHLDLLVASGAVKQLPERMRRGDRFPLDQTNQLYRGLGGGRFEDGTERAGPAFAVAEVSRGVATGDVDNDGDVDVLVTQNNGPVRLLRNRGEAKHHWLGLRLASPPPARDLLGTRLTVEAPGAAPRHRRVRSDGSYASASDPRVLVGLGTSAAPVSVRVEWPDGSGETFGPGEIDRYTTLVRGGGAREATARPATESVPGDLVPEVAEQPAPERSAPATVEPVPKPVLDGLEPRAAERLAAGRRALAEVLADPAASPLERGAAFGELGRLYHAYDFHQAAMACYRNAQLLAPEDVRWPYYLAHAYRATGDGAPAADAFERALELRGDYVPALVWLAQTELDLHHLDDAERRLRAALTLAPAFAPAHGILGDLALSRSDFPSAVEHYRQALALQPRADHLHYQLSTAYRGLGDSASAAAHLRQRGPGRLTFPDPLLRHLQGLNRSSKNLIQTGRDALGEGRLEVAVEAFRQALEADPSGVVARVNLGVALVRLGRRDEATDTFREALRHQPEDPTAHFNLATLAAAGGDDDTAIAHYRRAIAADSELRDAHFNLANALFRGAEPRAAAKHYARVRALDPGNVAALQGEALALARMDRYEATLARLEQGHRDFPGNRPIADALARVLAACPVDALRDGPRALELARLNFAAERTLDHAETLAMAHAEVGELDQAVAWQQQAIAVAERADRPDVAGALRETLEAYRRGEPSRRPWRW